MDFCAEEETALLAALALLRKFKNTVAITIQIH
jgi:hypothetical protein